MCRAASAYCGTIFIKQDGESLEQPPIYRINSSGASRQVNRAIEIADLIGCKNCPL
jgi:hypothetical protein